MGEYVRPLTDSEPQDAAVEYQGRKVSRAGSVERREKILHAVLNIIARDGIRGVKHRAVAKEAGVPLASTTYYFKDINDLMTDAFNFFAEKDAIHTNRFRDQSFEVLAHFADKLDNEETLKELADICLEFAVAHVMEQVSDAELRNRTIEQNFQIEASRNEKLRGPYIARYTALKTMMEQFYAAIGSNDPQADAQALKAIILDLEYEALIDPVNCRDIEKIRRVLKRHIYNSFKVKW